MKNIESLLKDVKTLVKQSKELSKLKGENFNIFSVLQIESNENNTHSRFLAELLSPKGSHDLSHTLLNHFVSQLPINKDEEKYSVLKKINVASASVILEKHIGKKNEKEGGRVDIIITDGRYSILIENKIYAGDQEYQIERYSNYKTSESIVLYLSLRGEEPTVKSKGELKNGKDFYCISYQHDITKWLEQCYKEAADRPILRETIKQYSILIKKLTGQLTTNEMTKKVRDLILNDIEVAEIVSENFKVVKQEVLEEIRESLKKKLLQDEHISEHYKITDERSRADDKNSKLWFYHKDLPESLQMYFGIEPFSGRGNRRNHLFIGIIDIKSTYEELFKQNGFDIVYWWRDVEYLTFEKNFFTLSNINFLKQLTNQKIKERFINDVANQVLDYIKRKEEAFLKVCEEAKKQMLSKN